MNQAQVVQSIITDFKHTTKNITCTAYAELVYETNFFYNYFYFIFFNTRHSGVKTGNMMFYWFSLNCHGFKENLCFCHIEVHLTIMLPSCPYLLLVFLCNHVPNVMS